jgi:hypothetical protein
MAIPRLKIAGFGAPRGSYDILVRCKIDQGDEGEGYTHDRHDQGDPQHKVKSTEDIIENLLPVLSLWRGYDILAKLLRQSLHR